MRRIARRSHWPAFPTNGLPDSASFRPGASPRKRISASGCPRPRRPCPCHLACTTDKTRCAWRHFAEPRLCPKRLCLVRARSQAAWHPGRSFVSANEIRFDGSMPELPDGRSPRVSSIDRLCGPAGMDSVHLHDSIAVTGLDESSLRDLHRTTIRVLAHAVRARADVDRCEVCRPAEAQGAAYRAGAGEVPSTCVPAALGRFSLQRVRAGSGAQLRAESARHHCIRTVIVPCIRSNRVPGCR